MSALADLLDERVSIARVKAGKAATEARTATGSTTAQAAADEALADLDHYVQLRDRIDIDRTGPYRSQSPASFFRDLAGDPTIDAAARARLDAYKADTRSTTAAFGGVVVPQYLVEELSSTGHASRPLVDVLAQPLPDKGMTIDIPVTTTGATAEDQATQNTAGTADNPVTAPKSFPVCTLWSEIVVSFQAADRMKGSGLDLLLSREVVAAVDALEEERVLSGSGSAGQPEGILNAGAGTYSATGTTAADLLDAIGRTAATIDDARGRPSDLVAMAPRRWRWLLANAGDFSAAVYPVNDGGPVVGKVLGMDVVASPSVPVSLGSSTNEDRVIVLRRDDVYVGDTPPMATKQRDSTNLGANLNAKLRVSRYYASGVVNTYGVQVIIGPGTVNPYSS